MATVEALLTAEEFADLPDDGRRTELVEGRIIELPPPNFPHGLVCGRVAFALMAWVQPRDLGRVVTNDSGIVTRRNPDSLRGVDVAYYSYARLPKDSTPQRYPDVSPDLAIEVRSPSDRWRDIHVKVAEYLNLGVLVVCVLDPETRSARLFYPDQPNQTLGPDDDLTLPECLPDFRSPVRFFFE